MAEIGILYREEGNRHRRGIRLRRQGLLEEHTLRRPRLIPWSEVARVEWRARTIAHVITLRETIRLDDRIEHFPELVESIDEHIRRAGLHTTVTPEGIERRLGVNRGGVLVDDTRRMLAAMHWSMMLVVSVCTVPFMPSNPGAPFTAWALVSIILLPLRWLPGSSRRADGQGVTIESRRGRRRYAWSELGVRHTTRAQPVLTIGKDRLGANSPRLKRTARAILAAQQLPYQSPGPRPAPDMALSRAEAPVDGLVERGLSRSVTRD